MANRFSFLTSISKHIRSTSSRGSRVFFSTAPRQHAQANPVINLEAGDTENDEDRKRGLTGLMADATKQGTIKATEVVENVADAAKETVDTACAWDATKNTAQNIREITTAEAETNVVDTAEYRSSEDLKGQLGDGHDNRIEI